MLSRRPFVGFGIVWMASISACGGDEVTSTSADVPGDIASPADDVAATDTEYVDTAGSDVVDLDAADLDSSEQDATGDATSPPDDTSVDAVGPDDVTGVDVVATTTVAMSPAGGGVLESGDGLLTFRLEPFSVTSDLTVTIAPVASPPAGAQPVSLIYELGPSGEHFAIPAVLCFDLEGDTPGADGCLGFYDEPAGEWACADRALVELQPSIWCGKTSHFTMVGLLRNTKALKTEHGSARIGPDGGSVVAASVGASVVVPPGAVAAPTLFIVASKATVPGSAGLGSTAVTLSPRGVALESPVEICVSPTAPAASTGCLSYYDESKGEWVCQDQCLTKKGDQLCGETDHFTSFAILLGTGSSEADCGGTWLDATGGTVKDPGGGAVLTVPAGALPAPTVVSLVKDPAPPGGAEFGSAVYEAGPDGLTFAVPVELCLPSNGKTPDAKTCLGYYDDGKGTWQCEDECLKEKDGLVCGKTGHFTSFAILLGAGSGNADCGGTWLDATGGTVKDPGGGAVLTVPKGALVAPTVISLVKDPAPPSGAEFGSAVYEAGPDGLTFAAPVELCLQSNGKTPDAKTCLGYYDDGKGTWQCEDECLKAKDGLVCGKTGHFTNFAILLGAGSGNADCGGTWIDATGGTVKDPGGGAVLTFPSGALAAPTVITLVKNPNPPAGAAFGSAVYDAGPDGLTFAVPVELCLDTTGVKPDAAACLGYYDETTGKWTCEDTCLKQISPSFWCGRTSHFTNFAILLGASSAPATCDLLKTTILAKTGGVAPSGDGAAFVDVPAMALTMDTVIAVSRDTQTLADPNALSAAYTFAPEGLSFSLPAMICIVTQGTIEADSPKCLATHDPAAGWSCVDPCLQEVESGLWCGLTDHFSTYAIVATPGALGCQGN